MIYPILLWASIAESWFNQSIVGKNSDQSSSKGKPFLKGFAFIFITTIINKHLPIIN
jgi:hypothetical protein